MTTSADGGLSVVDDYGVRRIVFNRPEKRNAITEAMWRGLADALEPEATRDVRVVTITGAGVAFTAGNDLRDFLDNPPRSDDASVFRFLRNLVGLEVPILASVRGAAVGVGTTVLLHCDIAFASPTAKFRLPFVDLGLVPEAASTVLLPRLIGRARANAALLLAEPISAEEALSWGLITALVPDAELDAKLESTAQKLLEKPVGALRATKKLLGHDRDEILKAMVREAATFRSQLASEEARTRMAALLAR